MTTLDLQNTFPSFPLLPLKIREEIWISSFPHFHSHIKLTISKPTNHISPASRPIPPLLHVNHESRSLAFRHYIRGFHVRNICSCNQENARQNGRLFWDRDDKVMLIQGTLPTSRYFPKAHHRGKMKFDELVKEIGVSNEVWRFWSVNQQRGWLCAFLGAERLTVYVNRVESGWNRDEAEWESCKGELERFYNELVKGPSMVGKQSWRRKDWSEEQKMLRERVRVEVVDMTGRFGGFLMLLGELRTANIRSSENGKYGQRRVDIK